MFDGNLSDNGSRLLDQKALDVRLHAKIRKPDAPYRGVARTELLHTILKDAQIVWLNAPAGYGKSIMMADFARLAVTQGQWVIWFNLDTDDQHAAIFLRNILNAAEKQIPGIATDALAHWHETERRGQVDIEQVLLMWLHELRAINKPIVFCLDNVRELGEASGWQVLVRLLEQLPSNIHMILASRSLPAALGRVRLIPNLSWLGSKELRFNDAQSQLLLANHDIEKVSPLLPHLRSYLQGWPAGLAIWLACYRASGQPELPAFGLAQTELSDYLNGEVAQYLNSELQEFIRIAGVLGEFSEPLLRHCYSNDCYHDLLQEALRRNLFIEANEYQLGWYRIHPIMGNLLASQLPLAQRHRIHQQAFEWLSRQQYPVAALRHALAADMRQEIQEWVSQEAETILANLDIAGLLNWLQQIDEALLHSSPRLMAIACWAYLLTHQQEKATVLLNRLSAGDYLKDFEEKALRGYLARLEGQLQQAEQLCETALNLLPPERFVLRILMASTLAHVRLAEQDSDGARVWNRLAQDLSRQYRILAMEALAVFDQARIELNRGNISHCRSIVDRGLELLSSDLQGAERLPRGRLLLYRALMLWLQGGNSQELDETLQQGISVSTELHDIAVCYGYAVKAIRYAVIGNYSHALNQLDDAERLMQRWQVNKNTYQWLILVRANIWLSQGKYIRAQQALDELMKGRSYNQLPRPEIFPMQQSFAQITQARLFLLVGRHEDCIQLIEKAMRQRSSTVSQAIFGMLRAVATRAVKQGDNTPALSQALKVLQREGIAFEILDWLPGLREPVVEQMSEELVLNSNLSERELDVLRKIAQGLSNQEIADQLFISLHTVKTHARKINVKLAAKSRTQALHRARELKLI